MKTISYEEIEYVCSWNCPYKNCGEKNEDYFVEYCDKDIISCRKCGRKIKVVEPE